jgi:hypothetical protein
LVNLQTFLKEFFTQGGIARFKYCHCYWFEK